MASKTRIISTSDVWKFFQHWTSRWDESDLAKFPNNTALVIPNCMYEQHRMINCLLQKITYLNVELLKGFIQLLWRTLISTSYSLFISKFVAFVCIPSVLLV